MAQIGSLTFTGWRSGERGLVDPAEGYTVLEPSPGNNGAIVLFGGLRYEEVELETTSVLTSSELAEARITAIRALIGTTQTITTPSGRTWTACLVLRARSAEPFADALGNWLVRTTWTVMVPSQA